MEDMARYPRLTLNKGTYYFRAKVPEDVRQAYGKAEEKISLRTSDRPAAVTRLHVHSVRFDRRVQELRDQQRAQLHDGKTDIVFITAISDAEVEQLATAWLNERHQAFVQMEILPPSPHEDEQDIPEIIQTLEFDQDKLSDELARQDFGHTAHYASQWLARRGIKLDQRGSQFRRFCRLFLSAQLHHTRRKLDHYRGAADPFAPAFNPAPMSAPPHTPDDLTFKELVLRFLARSRSRRVKEKTSDKDRASYDLFEEILGSNTRLSGINSDMCTELCQTVSRLPANRVLRFGSLPIEELLRVVDERAIAPMAISTQRGLLARFKRVFDYAHKAGYISRNPAAIVELPHDPVRKKDKRDSFSLQDLQKIFSAPLYTGCLNDERGVHTAGPNVQRRGRFWVPLISLWSGMRLNECCQLSTDDVHQQDEVWLIRVTDDEDEGKSVKTDHGHRDVPVHPELTRMGFIHFVQERQRTGEKRLFPELGPDTYGYFSGPFSKWFAYFLRKRGVKQTKLGFHSFRHTFTDALREADISPERQDQLGGWKSDKSERQTYGSSLRPATLYNEMRKIEYPGLDLSHLHIQSPNLSKS